VDTGDFRLIGRRVLDLLESMPERHRFLRGMVSWVGFKQVPLRYERDERFAGDTKYPLRKMVRLALDAVTGFSIKPLRMAGYLGLLFAALGAAALIYTLYSWAVLGTVQGWASVMTAVLVMGSVQLMILGLLGEYLGRLFVEAKQRPLFLIDTVTCADEQVAAAPKAPYGHMVGFSTAQNQGQFRGVSSGRPRGKGAERSPS
jgi:dolichol-phosphate mannosyltransferase